MAKTKDGSDRRQLNISPNDETMDKLNSLVEQFGARHKNVKNRNVAAADIIDKYIDLYS